MFSAYSGETKAGLGMNLRRGVLRGRVTSCLSLNPSSRGVCAALMPPVAATVAVVCKLLGLAFKAHGGKGPTPLSLPAVPS